MKIKNKIESSEIINELGLNKFPEIILKKGQINKTKSFLKKYPAKYYAIRDKSKSGGIFKLKVKSEDVLKEIDGYELFSINVSSINYEDNQLLVGEIEILSNHEVYLTVSFNPSYSVRDALKNPDINIKSNLFDSNLDEIPYFDFLYDYIVTNELLDVIVEFALFDINVGINNEKIVIYELRTDY